MNWVRVTKTKPCPVCQKTDWCSVAADGSVVCCQRTESDWVCKGSMGGWIHKLNPTISKRLQNVFRRKPPKKKYLSPRYWHGEFAKSQEGINGVCGRSVLARQLGVSHNSLYRLLCGWDIDRAAWTFPMWDGQGRMIGMRLRGISGRKFCIKGSHNGIFWPLEVSRDLDTLLFICEGPSDCAALLDLKVDAIGRPCATAGVAYIKDFLLPTRRDVVIVADNDSQDAIGIRGGLGLAKAIADLTGALHLLQPPKRYKDIRQWYNAGLTNEELRGIINQ